MNKIIARIKNLEAVINIGYDKRTLDEKCEKTTKLNNRTHSFVVNRHTC